VRKAKLTLVTVGDLQLGQRIRFHNGLWVTDPKGYEVVRFRPRRSLERGYLELKDPQTDRLEAAPHLLHGRLQVELVA
jgi:hypothetical protein